MIEAEHIQEEWLRNILPAVRARSIPAASLLLEARPLGCVGDLLLIEFPAGMDFHRRTAEQPQNMARLTAALVAATGEQLIPVFLTEEARTEEAT